MAINIRFKGIIGTLAQILLDKFAGRVAWVTDFARMIWFYDADNYAEMARRDVLETFANGIQDSTITSGQALVAGASGRIQSQDATTFRGTVGVPASSDALFGTTFAASDPFTNREDYATQGGVRTMYGIGPFGEQYYVVADGRHRNGTGDGVDAYGGMIAWEMLSATPRIAFRSRPSTAWSPWIELSRVGHDHQSITVDGIQRISSAGAATLASLQASNLSGPGNRALSAGPSGDIDDGASTTYFGEPGGDAADAFSRFIFFGGSADYSGIKVQSGRSDKGAFLALKTASNLGSSWNPQKRDDGLYGTSVGCFAIEDEATPPDASGTRFPIVIDPGATGEIRFSRPIKATSLAGTGTRPLVADTSGNVVSGSGLSSAITVVQNVTQTPPGSPVIGMPYLVASGATGAWAGQDDKLATWSGSAWSFAVRDARSLCYNLTTVSPVNATFSSGAGTLSGAEAFSATSFWATGIVYANAGFQSADLVLPGDHAIIADSTGKIKNLGAVTREMIIQPLPITNSAPGVVTVGPSGSMRSFGFDGVTQTEELFYHIDLQHDYIAGTNIVPHVHWMPSTNGTGDVVWKFDYQWVETGGTFGAPTTAACPAVAAGGTAWADKRSEVTISGAGHTYNSRLLLRLYRDPSDGSDNYGADAVLSSIGVHYSANPIQVG